MNKWLCLFLGFLFGLLAWKNPYKQNNLIGNLEPYPDTLYYSVSAWNLVQGNGFKMKLEDKQVDLVIPPGYNWLLVPIFKVTNDVRSYFWLNLGLAWLSLFVFIKVVEIMFDDWSLSLLLGIIWVTNFYNYNLPSLLMAENLLIPLVLATVWVLVSKLSYRQIRWSIVVAIGLVLTKMSALPIVLVLGLGMATKLWFEKDKELRWYGLVWGGVCGLAILVYLKINLPRWQVGNSDMELRNLAINIKIYLGELMGGPGNYLWYTNLLLEKWLGVFGFSGIGIGVIVKKYRQTAIILAGLILGTVVFHAMKAYPEGRYVSVAVPLVILGVGLFLKSILKKKAWLSVLFLLVFYLGQRVTINGFYERRATTLKRQVLNNFRTENEVPWNYLAVQFVNDYFKDKGKDNYLGTLLPAFYVEYFSNHHYRVLPVSETQEFSIPGRDLLSQYYKNDGSLLKMYHRLVESGKNVYVTNYYLQNHRRDWEVDFATLEKEFAFKQVAAGCMDLCKIYKLEVKPTRPAGTLP